jgi:hypothetical protein
VKRFGVIGVLNVSVMGQRFYAVHPFLEESKDGILLDSVVDPNLNVLGVASPAHQDLKIVD